jgi:hypothetical protein
MRLMIFRLFLLGSVLFLTQIVAEPVNAQATCCISCNPGGQGCEPRTCMTCTEQDGGECGCTLMCTGPCNVTWWCFSCPPPATMMAGSGHFDNLPVDEVLRFLSRRHSFKFNVVGDPSPRVSLAYDNKTLRWLFSELERLGAVAIHAEGASDSIAGAQDCGGSRIY